MELPPGTYELKVTFPNYETKSIRDVAVQAGEVVTLNINLSPTLVEIDDMKVVGKAKKDTEMVQLLRRKAASNHG